MPIPLTSSGEAHGGFTLMELAVVVLIIATVMAIAAPRFAPALAFGKLEGAARHLANYGRAAMAHSALTQERITIRFDLAAEPPEYWSVRWLEVSGDLFDDEEEEESGQDPFELARENALEALAGGQEEEIAAMADAVQERFERFFRLSLEAQARHVNQDGMLAGIGPEFKEFSLDIDEDEDTEEIKTNLLLRTALPRDVIIESARIGNTDYSDGTFELDVYPLGLVEPAVFYLRRKDDEEDYFTVVWDPITGGARVRRGKEEPE